MHARIERHFARAAHFFRGQQPGFQDDLDGPLVGGLRNITQFAQHIAVVAVFQPADVQHHLNLLRAVVDGHFGLVPLGVCVRGPERESDQARDLDLAVFEQRASEFDVRTIDADAVRALRACLGAKLLDVSPRRVRADQHALHAMRQLSR